MLGYEFFEYDSERGRAREFSPDVTPARDIRYWEKLDDIAYDIKQMLDTLARPAAQPTHDGRGRRGEDRLPRRDDLRPLRRARPHQARAATAGARRAARQGVAAHGPALREAVREYMARSSLSIHLLGGNYGIIPEEESRSLVEIQSEVAEESATSLPAHHLDARGS